MAAVTPLVVIVGPTASGKTALGIKVAQKFNGQIICADSRTVYKGLDIGTAKPTKHEQRAVQHHLIDIVEPYEHFSAAEFKEQANKAITCIAGEGRLPIMVGGTGLYIDSVIFNYGFAPKALAGNRNPVNPRHLSSEVAVTKAPLRPNTLVIGIDVDREILKRRITERVEAMFKSGLIDETKMVSGKYGWDLRSLQTPGYKAVRKFLEGAISLDEAKKEFIASDLSLAKRQITWFKRNKSIHHVHDLSKCVEIVTTFLNKMS